MPGCTSLFLAVASHVQADPRMVVNRGGPPSTLSILHAPRQSKLSPLLLVQLNVIHDSKTITTRTVRPRLMGQGIR